jgi:voltage-gated potassium channel
VAHSTLIDLDHRHRRRLIGRSIARIVVTTVVLLTLYAVIPVESERGAGAIAWLVLGLAAVGGILALQLRSILAADHPELRAIEALATGSLVLIIVFSFTYLSVWHQNHASFSESLNHVGAIYFTVTVLSTVGFGDIVAKTNLARILVTIQILVDLVVIVGIVRVITYTARVGVSRRRSGIPAGSRREE